MSGIVQDIEPGQTVGGYYAMQQKDCLKVQVVVPQLPELREQIANLKKQVQEMRQRMSNR